MRSIFLPVLALLFTSCLSYKEVVMHEIADVQVRKLDLTGVELTALVRLENPNGYRIHVKDPDVDLYLNGTFVGKGMLDSTLVLDKRTSRIYEIPLHAEFKGANLLMMLLGSALSGEARIGAKGTVVGQAGLLRKRFPFEVEEAVDLRSRP
jgi:LEA14-like dessication related protein